jgi:hypothetical protein
MILKKMNSGFFASLSGQVVDATWTLIQVRGGYAAIVNCALPTTADKKREALSEAVDLYLNGTWKIGEDGSNDSDEEEFPDIDSDGDWTGED